MIMNFGQLAEWRIRRMRDLAKLAVLQLGEGAGTDSEVTPSAGR
jgi:hypothetical protein